MTSAAEKIPKITLPRGPKKATDEEREEFAGLFGNSDDDDSDDDDTVRYVKQRGWGLGAHSPDAGNGTMERHVSESVLCRH